MLRPRGGGVVHISGRWRERRFGCEGDVSLRAGRAGPGRPGRAGHGAGPPASRAHGGLGREDPGLGRGWGAPRSFQRARGGRALPRDGTSAGRGPASELESGGAPAARGDRRPPPVIPVILQFGGQRTVPRGLRNPSERASDSARGLRKPQGAESHPGGCRPQGLGKDRRRVCVPHRCPVSLMRRVPGPALRSTGLAQSPPAQAAKQNLLGA